VLFQSGKEALVSWNLLPSFLISSRSAHLYLQSLLLSLLMTACVSDSELGLQNWMAQGKLN